MTISLRLSDEDTALFKKYAQMNNLTMSELVRQSVMQRIEDEFDLSVAAEAYDEYVKSGKKSAPISELWKDIDL